MPQSKKKKEFTHASSKKNEKELPAQPMVTWALLLGRKSQLDAEEESAHAVVDTLFHLSTHALGTHGEI